MALFYNILVLEEETKCDPEYMVEALRLYYKGVQLPKNARIKYKPIQKSLKGSSYLLNPLEFFEDKNTDVIYKAQYLRLSGRRDYTLYKLYGFKLLDLALFTDVNLETISTNPLLEITNKQIKFKYEK